MSLEFTNYISPDGLTYHFDDEVDHFIMDGPSGMGMPEIKYITQQGVFQHGFTIKDYRLQPRTIQLIHRHNSCSRQGYWDNRWDILNYLRPNRQVIGQVALGRLRKVTPDGTKRDIDVLVQQGPVFGERQSGSRWDEWAYQETIQFLAPDPTFYNPTQVSLTIGFVEALNWLEFPFEFSGNGAVPADGVLPGLVFVGSVIDATSDITYTGTWLSYPTITITGPVQGITINNTITGEKLALNYNVSVGEVVTIQTAYGNKSVTNNSGANLIGSLSTDSDLATFHLEPAPGASGGVNTITCSGHNGIPGVTQVVLAYYTRYIGI